MAKCFVNRPQIGDLCYHPFAVLKPGKIIWVAAQSDFDGTYNVNVLWLDESVTTENTLDLNDFNYVTEEHLKKYNKFDALRLKLKVL